eukprot:Skav224983  [mRNA]  locus=scaffold560:218107:224787:- [translate_table: standard]
MLRGTCAAESMHHPMQVLASWMMAMDGYGWLWMAMDGYGWMAMDGYGWLWADELTVLKSLEADVAELRKRRDQPLGPGIACTMLISERTTLEDASKATGFLQFASLQSLEQQLSELREAQRRSTQLKAAHEDFVKLLPPSTLSQSQDG